MAYKLILNKDEIEAFESVRANAGKSASAMANELIKDAVERGLAPKMSTLSSNDSMSTFALRASIEPKVKKHLSGLGFNLKSAPSSLMSALVRSAISSDHVEDAGVSEQNSFIERFFQSGGKVVRSNQMELTQRLISQHSNGGIGLHDASTGIGKTASKLCSAKYLIDNGVATSVVIAVPTNKLVAQTMLEAQNYGMKLSQLKARAEFISIAAIDLAMEEHPRTTDKLTEIKKHLLDNNIYEVSRLPEEMVSEIKCLGFPISLDVNAPDSDPAQEAYQLYLDTLPKSGLIICTHAMLANELYSHIYGYNGVVSQYRERTGEPLGYSKYQLMVRNNQKVGVLAQKFDDWFCETIVETSKAHLFENRARLPFRSSYKDGVSVFIDEAHLYPSQVELALTSSVSISLLMSRLKSFAQGSSGQLRKTCENACQALAYIANLDANTQSHTLKDKLSSVMDALESFLSLDFSNAKLTQVEQLKFNRIKSATKTLIDYSDSYHACRIVKSRRLGKTSVESIADTFNAMNILCATHQLSDSISYMSGTLNDTSGLYKFTSATLRLKGVTATRRLEKNKPLVSDWLHKDVVLKVRDEFEDNSQYKQKASVIFDEIKDTKGGCLVLCNSYDEVSELEYWLRKIINGNIPIIADDAEYKTDNVKAFKGLHKEHGVVIYLATGAAWTGIDITNSDAPPEDDNLMQTLVITKAPFEYHREVGKDELSQFNWFKYLNDTLVKFRQGLGRLVRREGRTGMQIIYLDAFYKKKALVVNLGATLRCRTETEPEFH